jgi:hypothetical protein
LDTIPPDYIIQNKTVQKGCLLMANETILGISKSRDSECLKLGYSNEFIETFNGYAQILPHSSCSLLGISVQPLSFKAPQPCRIPVLITNLTNSVIVLTLGMPIMCCTNASIGKTTSVWVPEKLFETKNMKMPSIEDKNFLNPQFTRSRSLHFFSSDLFRESAKKLPDPDKSVPQYNADIY